jgi:acetyl-CoA C-acetyltransferase
LCSTPSAPRAAKGKKDGSLHEVKPLVNLLAGVLTELQRRNDFDTARWTMW